MTKVQAFVYKTFKEFNNNLYLWKNEITTIKKNKIFNISVSIAHFWQLFSCRASHPLAQYTVQISWFSCILLWILTYFSNIVTFWKNSFCHSFLYLQDINTYCVWHLHQCPFWILFFIFLLQKRLICMLFMGLLSSKLPYIYFNMPFLLIRMAYPAFLKILNAFWMLEIHA